MRGRVSKKRKQAAKPAAKPAGDSATTDLPPTTAPAEKAEWSLKWLGLGVLAFALAAVPSTLIAVHYASLKLAAPIAAGLYLFVGVGFGVALELFTTPKIKAVVQSGISAVVAYLIVTCVLPVRLGFLEAKLDLFTYVVGGGTVAFDLACLGAFIGRSVKRAQQKTAPDPWDEAGAWLAKHGALPALLHITIVIACAHAHVFAGETVGDDLSFHFAEATRIADCLRVGDFDFWNPSANGGYASGYYYQVVPQLASAIPAAIFGYHLFWFQLSVWLPHVLAPAAAYRGMRVLGATPWQAVVAAFATAFMNGQSRWGTGNAGTFQVGLYTQTWALAALPLALGYGARWISEKRSLAPAIAWGGFVGLCHPFAALGLGLGLFLGWLVRMFPHRELGWSRLPSRACLIVGIVILVVLPKSLTDKIAGLDMPSEVLGAFVLSCLFVLAGLGLTLFDRTHRWKLPELRACGGEFLRLAILGVGYVITCSPVWVPLLVDWNGFGAFPDRVGDEVGPGFFQLAQWVKDGWLLDFAPDSRIPLLTYALPFVLLLGRDKILRWLWPAAFFYALFLGLGPHLGKIGADDLFPAVRVLGPLQIALALGIGLCTLSIGRAAWNAPLSSRTGWTVRIALYAIALGLVVYGAWALWTGDAAFDSKAGHYVYASALNFVHTVTFRLVDNPLALRVIGTVPLAAIIGFGLRPGWRALSNEYGVRTALAAAAAALIVFVGFQGSKALAARVTVFSDFPNSHRDEMMDINEQLLGMAQGRKQTAPGAENHWWNLLSFAYERIPSLLQMGGGGLQASPNYHFLWVTTTQMHDYARNAWVYDAPYVVLAHGAANRLPPDSEVVGTTKNYEIRKLPSPGVVSPVQVVGVLPPGDRKGQAGRQAAVDWLRSNKAMQDQVLAYNGFGGPGDPPAGKTIRAWHQDSPGDEADIVGELEVEKPTTFIVRESWHPRWHAYLDGDEIAVRRVTPDFPAVDVPAGKHTLAMRFERPWWATAVWLLYPLTVIGVWLGLRLIQGKGWPKPPRLRLPRALARNKRQSTPPAQPASPNAEAPSPTAGTGARPAAPTGAPGAQPPNPVGAPGAQGGAGSSTEPVQ
jgi:hypothetical protein